MRYLDLFDKPSSAWVRGDVVLSRQPGPLNLVPSGTTCSCTATLAGHAVHPKTLQESTIRVSFTIGPDPGGLLRIGFGHPQEWDTLAQAPLVIAIDRSGQITVCDQAGVCVASITPDEHDAGQRSLIFGKRGRVFFLQGPTGEVTIPWPGHDDGGYLTFEALGTPVTLQRFGVMSPITRPPLSREGVAADHEIWRQQRRKHNRTRLSELRVLLQDEVARLRWGFCTALTVTPGLLPCGTTVRLSFHLDELTTPNNATVEADYLGINPGMAQSLALEWREDPDGGWRAEVDLTPDKPGNWRVTWHIGTERLTRTFAVIVPGYAVASCWVERSATTPDLPQHRYDLPADCALGNWWSPFTPPLQEVLDSLLPYAGWQHRYGDHLVPLISARWLLPGIPNDNLSEIPAAEQTDLLSDLRTLWEMLDIGPMTILGVPTLGHATPHAAQALGVKALHGLAPWKNQRDGDANAPAINHWGASPAPYFVADDDFRKTANQPAIVAFAAASASSARCYLPEGVEGSPTCLALHAGISRFYDAVDGWLAAAAHQDHPYCFTVALTDAADTAWSEGINALAIEYLVSRARTGNLVFASSADIAEYYQTQFPAQPIQTWYWPDLLCGVRAPQKPARLPDRIEIHTSQLHALFADGLALPHCYWEFTSRWEEPIWSALARFRSPEGLISPETIPPEMCVPRQVALDDATAIVNMTPVVGGVEIVITLTTSRALDLLPIAIWSIPLTADTHVVSPTTGIDWHRVIDGSTGNLHAIVLCAAVPAGTSEYRLRLVGTARELYRADFSLGTTLHGRTITRDGEHITYLWRADETPPGLLRTTSPATRSVEIHYRDSAVTSSSPGQPLEIPFLPDDVPWLLGMTGEDLAWEWTYEVQG